MAHFYLLTAIFLEIAAAIASRYTEGFTAPLPTTITIVFAVTSYYIFSLSLKHGMNIGIGYAIWSGVGVLTIALIGATLLGDTLTTIQIIGIILIIIGLFCVQLAGKAEDTEKVSYSE
ncbi:multidrug efflux SMR transporter [Halalkalibacter sp. APA_J-10(15)]|uniref:DMT family transporter n=1 Tax=unclassified Halalkalibacter TaxID=2893063 RepID=UPI001FF4DA8D|nr:SMR family transporter [Halalkalibacter sp. APA_J-10(15)]MCK0471665.1 SMR family transporter [Halalkalibacter sp. APA_J-10(15)]